MEKYRVTLTTEERAELEGVRSLLCGDYAAFSVAEGRS